MVDELVGKTIGERIQILRERRGKSRAVVAGLVGRSEEWLKAVEKGRLQPPRLDMLIRIAEVLGVQDLEQLTGQRDIPLGLVRRAAHDAVPAIREAIEEIPLVVAADPRPDAEDLRRRVSDAWRTWHASAAPREALSGVLPQLIRDCQRAVRVLDGRDRRTAYAALSEVYALCEQVLAWVADASLVWLVADRGMLAAQQADDPLVLAGAAWVMGNVQRATGREEDAIALVREAAALLEPRLADGSDAERAMWGALQLHAAITSARLGREGDALRYWDLGNQMARRLPDGYAHPWTVFGTANVAVTAVTVHADLRKGGRALEDAERVDPDSVPSLERRSRLWLAVARSYHLRKDNVGTLNLLRQACDVSLEAMRCHPLARGLVSELVTSGGRLVERDARALAQRFGLAVV
ncbi:helix-turn-helix domain-containing protein [Carbonactinospora thermoautotrophica]|uniref:helix-turn-helix domain-containing protein n=1 Tax=Carbonactinospora thermoautotrophica TaxID=1469144 RepID=UPI00226E7EE1|nr:helix-turn-helix transcriptional regulator [Carbonactinospora thermoautotrophica]